MRNLLKMTLVLGLAALVASPALAQGGRGGRGGRGGGMFGGGGGAALLMQKAVQDELKVTEDQLTKVQGVQAKVREKFQDDFGRMADMSQEERTALFQKIAAETTKEVNAVLNPEQQKRLKQLQVQQEGALAFVNNEDLTKALKLNDEQKEKLKTIADDFTKDAAAFGGFGGGRGAGGRRGGGGGGGGGRGAFDPAQMEENFKKREALRKEAVGKSVAVLSADQKKTYEDMTGKAFEFKFTAPRPPQTDR